jgi:hypothetical protein
MMMMAGDEVSFAKLIDTMRDADPATPKSYTRYKVGKAREEESEKGEMRHKDTKRAADGSSTPLVYRKPPVYRMENAKVYCQMDKTNLLHSGNTLQVTLPNSCDIEMGVQGLYLQKSAPQIKHNSEL